MSIFERYGLKKVINASGTMTALGSCRASDRVIGAMMEILPEFIEMIDLQSKASEIISLATGGEAGVVTGSCAGGISVAVAACMTGKDLSKIEQLPDTSGMKTEVVLQKGHACNFGAGVEQMVCITGARPIEIGDVNAAGIYQLEGAINENTVAALYVISHHTVQSGLISLGDFCKVCNKYNVPVIVDAASEYDLRAFLNSGADLVIYSGHKFLGGPTSGIITGKRDLIQACYYQEKGIGRGIKVGKEGVIGVMEALQQWVARDAVDSRDKEMRRISYGYEYLNKIEGIRVEYCPDPTSNPINRLQVFVDPHKSSLTAFSISRLLSENDPIIKVRDHHVDSGYFLLDPCNLLDGEMEIICETINALVANPPVVEREENLADLRLRDLQNWP